MIVRARFVLLGVLLFLPRVVCAQAPSAGSQRPNAPAPLVVRGDTVIVNARTAGSREMRLLALPDTVWLLDGKRREMASPQRAVLVRTAVRAMKLKEANRVADSMFRLRHPELRPPKR